MKDPDKACPFFGGKSNRLLIKKQAVPHKFSGAAFSQQPDFSEKSVFLNTGKLSVAYVTALRLIVMPAKAGIQNMLKTSDSGFFRNHGKGRLCVHAGERRCAQFFNIAGFRLMPE